MHTWLHRYFYTDAKLLLKPLDEPEPRDGLGDLLMYRDLIAPGRM